MRTIQLHSGPLLLGVMASVIESCNRVLSKNTDVRLTDQPANQDIMILGEELADDQADPIRFAGMAMTERAMNLNFTLAPYPTSDMDLARIVNEISHTVLHELCHWAGRGADIYYWNAVQDKTGEPRLDIDIGHYVDNPNPNLQGDHYWRFRPEYVRDPMVYKSTPVTLARFAPMHAHILNTWPGHSKSMIAQGEAEVLTVTSMSGEPIEVDIWSVIQTGRFDSYSRMKTNRAGLRGVRFDWWQGKPAAYSGEIRKIVVKSASADWTVAFWATLIDLEEMAMKNQTLIQVGPPGPGEDPWLNRPYYSVMLQHHLTGPKDEPFPKPEPIMPLPPLPGAETLGTTKPFPPAPDPGFEWPDGEASRLKAELRTAQEQLALTNADLSACRSRLGYLEDALKKIREGREALDKLTR